MDFTLILFLILAITAVATAAGLLISRNAVYAALFLVLNFATVAVFYLLLGAPFIALAQVTIYAGAIMVLFLFVIMLLGADALPRRQVLPWQRPLAIVRHPRNLGKGAAIVDAAAWAGTRGFTHLVTLDADAVSLDGAQALERIRSERPDMAILDVMMPHRNGFEVCQDLRQDPEFKTLRIMMLTAKGRDTEVSKGLALGADVYMTKPFATRDLIAKVKALIERD